MLKVTDRLTDDSPPPIPHPTKRLGNRSDGANCGRMLLVRLTVKFVRTVRRGKGGKRLRFNLCQTVFPAPPPSGLACDLETS